jgi:hypothetical protein
MEVSRRVAMSFGSLGVLTALAGTVAGLGFVLLTSSSPIRNSLRPATVGWLPRASV